MQSTQPQFRLDYFGDDVPEWLSADDVAMVIECSYRHAGDGAAATAGAAARTADLNPWTFSTVMSASGRYLGERGLESRRLDANTRGWRGIVYGRQPQKAIECNRESSPTSHETQAALDAYEFRATGPVYGECRAPKTKDQRPKAGHHRPENTTAPSPNPCSHFLLHIPVKPRQRQ